MKINSIIKLVKKRTICQQMILVQFVIILLTFSIMGGGIYFLTCEILKRENLEVYDKTLMASDKLLDEQLKYYQNEARVIFLEDAIQTDLAKPHATAKDGQYMEFSLFNKLRKQLQIYVGSYTGIQSIYIFDLNGAVSYYDKGRSSGEIQSSVTYEQLEKEEWFQTAVRLNGKEYFVGEDVLFHKPGQISCVKLLRGIESLKTIGLMVINIDASKMGSIFGAYMEDEGIYILADSNHLIYSQGFIDSSVSSPEDLLLEDIGGYEKNVCHNTSTGWNLYHIISSEKVIGGAHIIGNGIVLLLVVALVIMVLATTVSAKRITAPLYCLKDAITQVGKGARKLPDEFDDSEIGEIGKAFRNMVQNQLVLNEKITKEELKTREAELMLLQSQINPHFLYNTLDSLYWMAILRENVDIAEMVQALSEIFRISLSKGKEVITVQEELTFIKDYVKIQNMFYDNRFTLHILVDSEVRKLRIIKLLLEPFVENAILHGLEPRSGPGTIVVSGKVEEEMVWFLISDDGVGMETETAMERGYAIKNVIERLKLTYGEVAGMQMESELGKGTVVKLYIPLENMKGGRK